MKLNMRLVNNLIDGAKYSTECRKRKRNGPYIKLNKERKNRHVYFDDQGNIIRSNKKKSTKKNRRTIVAKPPFKKPINPPNKNRNEDDELTALNKLLIFFPEQFFDNAINGGKDKPSINNEKKETSTDSLCRNLLCDHQTFEENAELPPLIGVTEIKTIDDLITMGKAYHCKKQTTYRNINLRLMNNLVGPLTELNQMIGLGDVKTRMVDQILFFLQGFNTAERCNKCTECTYNYPCVQSRSEMLHTVITGPPGVGKTCMARIIGRVYKEMGILSNGEFHEVARSDLIAKYLGQTAIKTQEIIDKCAGGVMFIDEAYSLGHKENRDSFAKECLDTLNKNLSERRDFLCIIAGYKNELEDCFFSANPGLTRRFTFRYDITEYDYKELLEIFKGKVEREGWKVDLQLEMTGDHKYIAEDLDGMFRKHREYFPYCGGDVETLFLQCKIAHARRMPNNQKTLNFTDFENGFRQFVKNRKYDETKKKGSVQYIPMYT